MGQNDCDRSEIAFFDVETTVPSRTGQGFAILEFGSASSLSSAATPPSSGPPICCSSRRYTTVVKGSPGNWSLAHRPARRSQMRSTIFFTEGAFPFFMSGVVSPVVMPSSAHMYQNNIHDLQNHANSAMNSSMLPHCNQGMASFPYYPVGKCLPLGQVGSSPPWPSLGSNSSASEKQTNNVDRREAALIKFRQKRKERCFDKKIRYINRKKLAERRPRVRGQFVRKASGVNVDLNGHPTSAEDEDEAGDNVDLAS